MREILYSFPSARQLVMQLKCTIVTFSLALHVSQCRLLFTENQPLIITANGYLYCGKKEQKGWGRLRVEADPDTRYCFWCRLVYVFDCIQIYYVSQVTPDARKKLAIFPCNMAEYASAQSEV